MSSVSSEGGDGQDFDLNIAPIIDCFTVLIAYLLVTASFLSLTVFDVGVAVSGEAVTPAEMPKDPPLSLAIQLDGEKKILIRVTGGASNLNQKIPIDSVSSAFNIQNMETQLKELHEKWPDLSDASLSADATVTYKDVVKVIETVKPLFPKIYLSGEKVSLSNDHENALH